MKKLLLSLVVALTACSFASAMNVTVSDTIKSDTKWTSSNIYVISGFVFVKTGSTLTIEPGTIIKGDTGTRATLIIQRGAKIMAQGTANAPIVFTSGKPAGSRTRGDWGGVVLLGASQVNDYTIGTSGDTIWPSVEGFPPSIKEPIRFGGSKLNDNSGVLSYVRIEFAGVAYSPDNEINGLTLGGVGSGTTLDHIQVSFSNDDSYEFFGGTVNAKYLIANAGTDDNWDTDNSYSGNVQFCLGRRDPKNWDVSAKGASNGFESDNISDFYTTRPRQKPWTMAKFSNVTEIGPWYGDTATDLTKTKFQSGMLIRRNSRLSVFNSLVTGWKNSIEITGGNTAGSLEGDTSAIKNVWFAGNKKDQKFNKLDGRDTFNIKNYLLSGSRKNAYYGNASDMKLSNPYDFKLPSFLPLTGSPLIGAADYSDSRINSFFDKTANYVGAFGTSDWTYGWAVWDPQNYDYSVAGKTVGIELDNNGVTAVKVVPNPASYNATLVFASNKSQNLNISILNLNGQVVETLKSTNVVMGNNNISLPIENISNGMYIVRIAGANGVSNAKISIQK